MGSRENTRFWVMIGPVIFIFLMFTVYPFILVAGTRSRSVEQTDLVESYNDITSCTSCFAISNSTLNGDSDLFLSQCEEYRNDTVWTVDEQAFRKGFVGASGESLSLTLVAWLVLGVVLLIYIGFGLFAAYVIKGNFGNYSLIEILMEDVFVPWIPTFVFIWLMCTFTMAEMEIPVEKTFTGLEGGDVKCLIVSIGYFANVLSTLAYLCFWCSLFVVGVMAAVYKSGNNNGGDCEDVLIVIAAACVLGTTFITIFVLTCIIASKADGGPLTQALIVPWVMALIAGLVWIGGEQCAKYTIRRNELKAEVYGDGTDGFTIGGDYVPDEHGVAVPTNKPPDEFVQIGIDDDDESDRDTPTEERDGIPVPATLNGVWTFSTNSKAAITGGFIKIQGSDDGVCEIRVIDETHFYTTRDNKNMFFELDKGMLVWDNDEVWQKMNA